MVGSILARSVGLLAASLLLCGAAPASADPYSPTGEFLDFADPPPDRPYPRKSFDEDGIPIVEYAGQWYYNPVTIAQYGLREYSLFVRSGGDEHRANAVKIADWLVAHQDASTGKWLYPFDFPVGGMGVTLYAPWSSAMGQGQAVSLLTRVAAQSGEQAYLDAAEAALAPLQQDVDDGGLTAYLDGLPYYEEYPTTPPSFTLNGFMYALLGLYDLGSTGTSPTAVALYDQGADTLEASLHHYDLGNISAYHLGHITNPPRPWHTSAFYHHLHVAQLRALDSVDPRDAFRQYADLWESYDVDPPNTSITGVDARPGGVTFEFESSEAGSAFQCHLDGAPWRPCSSPKNYSAVPVGRHEFGVKAIDGAGNDDRSEASVGFSIPKAPRRTTRIAAPPPPAPDLVSTALDRVARALKRLGARRLLGDGAVRVRLSSPIAGTWTIRLTDRAGLVSRLRVLARGARAVPAGGTGIVRVRLTRRGRALLRGSRKPRLAIRVDFLAADGDRSAAVRRARLRPAGRRVAAQP